MVNYDMTVRDNDGSVIQFLYGEDGIDVMNTKYMEQFEFFENNFTSLVTQYNTEDIYNKVNKKEVRKLKKEKFEDPILSKLNPGKYFGAISDRAQEKLGDHVASMKEKAESKERKLMKYKYDAIVGSTLKKMYYMKYMKSVAEPGENVGTIAAQSIGEPST